MDITVCWTELCWTDSVRSTLPKIENLLYFFLGLTNFSENFVYYVFYGSEFNPGVYSVILGAFTRYFRHKLIFPDFWIIFFVPPIISRIWHEKSFPNFYGGPMTDIYEFWKFHGNPSIILDFRFHGFNANYTSLFNRMVN